MKEVGYWHMLKMPSDLQVKFRQFWIKAVPKDIWFYYQNWPWYYLDFCHNCRFVGFGRESLYNVYETVYSAREWL